MNPQPPNRRQSKTSALFLGTSDGLAIYRAAGHNVWQRVGHALAGATIRAILAADAQTLLVAAGCSQTTAPSSNQLE